MDPRSKELQTKYLPAKLLPALELVQPREMKGVLTVTEGCAARARIEPA